MSLAEQTSEQIRNQILDAAFQRFARYGFGKTTMAEIARDCDMSAGNLYRYYENKKEIGAGCAERCMKEAERECRDILRMPGYSVTDRLKAVVLKKLDLLHEQFSQNPPLFELVLFVCEERQDLIARHLGTLQSIVAEILAEGNRSGEFDVPDILETANSILAATSKYIAPHFMGTFPLEQLRKEADGVIDLLVRGLARR